MAADPRRTRPPERTLQWVVDSLGAGGRIAGLRRLTTGGWHANHAVAVADARGVTHRLVLRRWARPEWKLEDPDFTAEREAAALDVVSAAPVPTPLLVAADPDGAVCDVPTLLMTRLPGRPPGLPADMDSFLGGLADAWRRSTRVGESARDRIPEYRRLPRPALGRAAGVVRARAALGARARARVGAAAAGPALLHPSRLPPREHALVGAAG